MNNENKTLLWLDDLRDPFNNPQWLLLFSPIKEPYNVVWVKNYDQFVEWIEENGLPHAISFDHDLADEHYAPPEYQNDQYYEWLDEQTFKENTGLECAHFVCNYCEQNELNLPFWGTHSFNPAGKKKIDNLLNHFLKKK